MVEAACVDTGLPQDGRDARGVEALLVEELERGEQDSFFRRRARHGVSARGLRFE
jgi:hypothetical protein